MTYAYRWPDDRKAKVRKVNHPIYGVSWAAGRPGGAYFHSDGFHFFTFEAALQHATDWISSSIDAQTPPVPEVGPDVAKGAEQQEPPERLVTVEDYEGAPVGTQVEWVGWKPKEPWTKTLAGGWVHPSGPYWTGSRLAWVTDGREVIRWGEPSEARR